MEGVSLVRGRLAALGLMVAMLSWTPAAAQVDDDQLRRAQAELAQLQEEARELTEEYQNAWAADAELRVRIDQLQSTIAGLGVDLERLRERIRERAVELYMDNAAATGLASLLISASPTDLDTRSEYLHDIRQKDEAMLNGLEILTARLEAATEELQREKEEQESVLARLEEVAIGLNERLEEGQAAYLVLQQRQEEERARREEERRAELAAAEAARAATSTSSTAEPATTEAPTTTAEPATTEAPTTTAEPISTEPTTTEVLTTTAEPATTTEATTTTEAPTTSTTNPVAVTDTTLALPGGDERGGQEEANSATASAMTCPVGGFSTFSDTWGAPRSGGRRHQGVDFLAARGTPVVAVEDGTVERMQNGGLGGITVWLRGRGGDSYYYAHLDAWAPGLSVNQEVSVGQQLGIVGTTGNAPSHIPHLHWEFHPGGYVPGGSSAVNPTPLARELC